MRGLATLPSVIGMRSKFDGAWAQWRCASILVAGALLATAVQPPNADGRPPLVTGITEIGDFSPDALKQAKATGAQLVRVKVSWAGVAPRNEPSSWQPDNPADPNYNWAGIDVALTKTVEAGLTPMAMVYKTPRWAQGCNPPPFAPESVCAAEAGALAAFAKAAARRYSGHFAGLPRVRYWQGLNEPNLSISFNPQFKHGRPVSPAIYRSLINSFYFAVKSASRSNLVIAAGLGPIAIPRHTVGPLRFARLLLCMHGRRKPKPTRGNCHGGVHFDIFDIHPYTTGGPKHKSKIDDVGLGSLEKLTELIRAADEASRIKGRFRHTPIWNTEFSWDSKPPDPGGLPMPILTRWTAEAIYRNWSAGITRFFWLTLRDNPPNPQLPFDQTIEAGLYFRGATIAEDQPKPNMYAFRFPFVAYSEKEGFSFWGRTPTSKGGRVLIQIRQGGNWWTVEVTRADRHGIFEGEIEGFYGRNKHGSVRARYREEKSIPFSLTPVRDFWQPPFGKPVG